MPGTKRVLTLAASRGRRTVYTLAGRDGARRLSSHVDHVPVDPSRFRARLVSVPLDTVAYEELTAAGFSMTQAETHDLVRIVYVQGGALRLADSGAPPLGPGDATVIDTSRPFRLSAAEPVRLSTLILPRDALRFPASVPERLFLSRLVSPLRPAWTALVRSLGVAAPDDGTAEAAALARTVVDLSRALIGADGAAADPLAVTVQQARDLIERDYVDPDLTPARIAAELGISERRLHRLFRTEDLSVAQSIRRRRVDEAAHRLIITADPFRTIATAVGFGSSDSAHRAFRAFRGVSPSRYRLGARAASTVEPHNPTESTAFRAGTSDTPGA